MLAAEICLGGQEDADRGDTHKQTIIKHKPLVSLVSVKQIQTLHNELE